MEFCKQNIQADVLFIRLYKMYQLEYKKGNKMNILKMLSPSSIKKIENVDISETTNIVFNENKRLAQKSAYLFIGNAVHNFIEYFMSYQANYKTAFATAMALAKRDLKTDLTKPLLDTIQNNIKYCLDYLANKDATIEMPLFFKGSKVVIGGTADIVIDNKDGTYTVADFKNYNNPSQADLVKHYYQALTYANLLARDGFTISHIEIVYPSQEQVVKLSYQDIDFRDIKSRW